MRFREWNLSALIGVAILAGVIQSAAGVVMYLAGVYFAPWSMAASVAVLLLCIVAGTSWYTTHFLNNEITYAQAVLVGATISVGTGLVYAVYNLITIRYFYPNFLDEVVRARMAQAGIDQQGSVSFAALRSSVSAASIAIPNLVRLSIYGTVLSVLAGLFLKRKVVPRPSPSPP